MSLFSKLTSVFNISANSSCESIFKVSFTYTLALPFPIKEFTSKALSKV